MFVLKVVFILRAVYNWKNCCCSDVVWTSFASKWWIILLNWDNFDVLDINSRVDEAETLSWYDYEVGV